MELPQPRPLETQATHDFLSLYSSATAHAQQNPTPSQGGYLKTHDFLQPLEQVGNNANTTREENKSVMSGVERPPVAAPSASVEHLLPGGIGTYSISYFNQRVLNNPEGSLFTAQPNSTSRNDENSNCSSHGSGFTLWDESVVKKGKAGKENIALREAGANVVGGQWVPLLEKPSQSSSNHKHNMTTFSSFSSSQPSSSQRNQSFTEMITSAKNDQEEDDDDEEDEFVIKKEPSSYPKDHLSVKIEAKIIDQKPNTPRSKHSATEQRRRSKINDRHVNQPSKFNNSEVYVYFKFQKLRGIIPNSDQKRDKASFLLEVIDYIQFLQEKVNKYETSYDVWNHEPSKIIQWKNSHTAEGFLDHAQGANTGSGPASVFARKVDEMKTRASSSLPINGQNLMDSDISTITTIKERGQLPELTQMQPNIFTLGRTSITAASPVSPKQQPSDTDKTMTWPPSTADKTNDQELAIESGTISFSSVYSQRLLNTLTQALQTSGVDLSQANISVQIDLGKRANSAPRASTHPTKGDDVPAALPHSRAASAGEEFGHTTKRLKTS
ncbi:transcription factor bim1 [Phtheirospermum japonicum]|uniref:Transcription factor bim1 n=1 Tax=Phtheirospermum japonicum TaxID=374723 RepID=A0A830BBX7_9LAMI|nr:transcription factor bim1 [Phtheirospermum japonicum]